MVSIWSGISLTCKVDFLGQYTVLGHQILDTISDGGGFPIPLTVPRICASTLTLP